MVLRLRDRRALVRTLAATSFGFALVQLDVTVVNVALPRIGVELGTGVAGLQWVVDGYALVFAALLLSAGFCGDRYGARRVYLAGLGLFALASAACGLAWSAPSLILARALQGVGAAAMLPSSLALLNHAAGHDSGLRAWAIGWWTAAGAITIAAGPIVGGLILAAASWRAIFLVNLPVCALGAWLAYALRETAGGGRSRGFDPLGQVLGVVALGALVAATIEARPLGLGDPRVLGLFATGIAAAAAFVAAEARVAAPMLPLALLRAPGVGPCLAYGMAMNFTYYGLLFILSLYLQHALGYSATQAGFAYLPLTATFFVANLISGALTASFGSRLPMVGGALVDLLGFALLLRLGLGSPYLAMVLPFMLIPLGMGVGVPAATTAVLAGVAREQSGIAAAVFNAARQAAGAIGVAVFGGLAGEGPGHIVGGLHAAALVTMALLASVALLAAFGIRRHTGETQP